MIIPYLADLINDQKNNRDESNEWKIQLNEKFEHFLCGVIMKKLDLVMKQMILLM